ncbi:MAG TPA: alanine--tRNA ligase-related protein, partial [Anaerolineales bacterium]|nr:alanine--tRNA ligase-related protein [Anaerolineales bacterium]
AVIKQYGGFYPEVVKSRETILDNLRREEIRFARTVEAGTAQLQNLLDRLRDTSTSTLDGAASMGVLDGHRAFDLYATYGLPFEIARDIAREQNLDVDEVGFRSAMDKHRLASGGGKAMGKLGGEDAEFFAGILKDLQKKKKLGEQGVEYDPYTSPRVEGEVLALIVNGQSVESASFGDPVDVILPKTGFYIESGGQVDDTGYIKSLAGGAGAWEIEVTGVHRASAGVIVHVGEVISGQPKVGDLALAEVDMRRRHDIMRNHTATHLLHAALHQVLGEHARQAGSLVAPDRLRFDFNHPEAMTPEQVERVERIVNEAVAADMEVVPKLKAREDAIAEGAMALFGEKYGETVRTITIAPLPGTATVEQTEIVLHPTATVEQKEKYSYELCGGTHLERTSDVGAFIILSEGSAAAGVRRIEAVTGRGAYDLIAHRSKLLKQAAAALKTSLEEVPFKVESLQDEVADLKKEVATLRASQALSTFNRQLSNVQMVRDVNVMALEIPNSNVDTLRTLADKFREKYPKNGVALLTSGGMVISVVTEDLVKRGLKAGDLITSIGGRGGGRPNLAQGSLPDPALMNEAMDKVARTVEEKLK